MKMVLTDIYESNFGIYDHLSSIESGNNSRPLVSVALHEAELLGEGSDLYTFISIYFGKRVLEHTGIKLHEFIRYPKEIVEVIYREIDKIETKKNRETEDAERQISKELGKK